MNHNRLVQHLNYNLLLELIYLPKVSDISTTLIYTKVSNKNIRNIKSPLDD